MSASDELRFFDPRAEIGFTANRLPHWQQDGAVYFVTFRLGDSVPQHLLTQWHGERERWLKQHPPPWTEAVVREYHRRFTAAMEQWLDAGNGACVLRQPECAGEVAEALRHFAGVRLRPIAWVIMPNHVHALFALRDGYTLEGLLHSWKRFTAQRINARLGRTGSLWQRDYFDRLVRDAAHLARCVRYIRKNPGQAKLRDGEFVLWESDLAKQIE
jgi:REP element-mobilizing transposase RayT